MTDSVFVIHCVVLSIMLIIDQNALIHMRLCTLSLLLFCWLGSLACLKAQDQIDKYCLLINETSGKALGEKNTFKLFLGYDNSLVAFKDTALFSQLKQVERRTTLVDAWLV